MSFSSEQIDMLKAPLDAKHVKERSQAGRKFSYIEGWHVIAEANRIFGFDAWDRETVEIKCVAEHETKIGPAFDSQGNPQQQRAGWRIGYICKVRITVRATITPDTAALGGWGVEVVREGCGYGAGIDVDLGQAHESALKEAETDAMKRALMTFGNPLGLALYDKQQREVERATPPTKAAQEPPATRPAGDTRTSFFKTDALKDAAAVSFKAIQHAISIAETMGALDGIERVQEAVIAGFPPTWQASLKEQIKAMRNALRSAA